MQQRERWYDERFDHTPIGFYSSTREGRFQYVNPALARLLGYDSVEEVLALKLPQDLYVNPDERKQLQAACEPRGQMQGVVARWKKKSGEPISVSLYARAVYDVEGKLQAYEGVALDITEQERAQAALQQSQIELQTKTRSLETINAVADAVYHSLDLQPVVESALDRVTTYLHVPGASIFLLDEAQGVLRRIATRGISHYVSQVTETLPLSESFNGLCVTSRNILISHDLEHEDRISNRVKEALIAQNIHQIIVVPLLFRERVVGTLSLPLEEHRQLTTQERETLLSVGTTIGLAIANAQYVAQIQAEVRERQRAQAAEHEQRVLAEALRDTAAVLNSDLEIEGVLDRILIYLTRVIPYHTANVMLVEAGVARVVRARGYQEVGLGDAVLFGLRYSLETTANFRWMTEHKQALVISDVQQYPRWVEGPQTAWIRSHVSAPILVAGQVMGFLNMDSTQPHTFNDGHAATLKIFADQVGVALHNARLYDDAREHAALLEQRVAERTQELELERAKLQAILDGMEEGVTGVIYPENLTLDNYPRLQPTYRYINRALQNLLGYNLDEWDTSAFRSRHTSPADFEAFNRTVNETFIRTGIFKGEIALRRKDGTEFDASLTSTGVHAADGSLVGGVTLIRDISQEKAAAAQKARFIANASHELRTPITNLKTRLYLTRRQPERMQTHLEVLERVTDHMQDLVEYLLDLSRLERGLVTFSREPMNLSKFVAEVVDLQRPEAEKEKITLSISLPSEPISILGNPGRLNQVITNLVVNGIKFTPPGGKVAVQLACGTGDWDGYALIEVRDTGIGISPDSLGHIFKPFYHSAKSSGVGLGLSISKEIVELHGGQIRAESAPDKGTRFQVALPLAEAI